MAPHRRNKSGLLPLLYDSLTQAEREQVRAAQKAYNEANPESPFFQTPEFYQAVYRQPKTSKTSKTITVISSLLGITGALAVAGGSCLFGNICFAASNPPLIAQFWLNGGSSRVLQFCICEGLALLGIALQLGGIT